MTTNTDKKYIRMVGTNTKGERIEKYYSGSLKAAESDFLKTPLESGGPTSWSAEVISELPDHVYLCCPSCGEKVVNTYLVKES